MKTIDVQKQPILSFQRTMRLALKGVRYRLFRAAVTVTVIAVAMSFLMNILAESLAKRAVADKARREIEQLRAADKWIARMSIPQTAEEIIEQLAEAGPGAAAIRECAFMSGRPETEIAPFTAPAKEARGYLRFFAGIDYGRRRVLAGNADGVRIFDALLQPEALAKFFDALKSMKAIRSNFSPEAFVAFLKEWPRLKELTQQVREGQAKAIASIQGTLDERPLLEWMENADGDFGERIRKAGFILEQAEADTLAGQAKRVKDGATVDDAINNVPVRQEVAARLNLMPGDVTVDLIWKLLANRRDAEWFREQMSKNGLDVSRLDAGRLVDLARGRVRARLLVRTELMTQSDTGGFMGIGRRMSWLVLVSMLVCAVGIANAMLMSVTERFREIATLKCLGALDGFIMKVFLAEAAMMGLVGGLVGTIAGLLLGTARMIFIFKGLLLESFPAASLVAGALVSIGVGMALAAIAAVYPSLRAARLAPMEAMRIE